MTFVRYVSIQLLAYGLDMCVFLLILQTDLATPLLANVLAKLVAGLFAFIFHKYFTFRCAESRTLSRQAVKYFLLLSINIPLASVILVFLLLWITEPVMAKFVADIICVALTYAVSKRFVFRGQQQLRDSGKCTEGRI